MSVASDYIEAAIINHLRGTTFPAAPANVYVALYTSATTDSGGGTEVTGGAYARVAVPGTTASWTAPSTAGVTSNAIAITFPTPTAAWGTITHVGIRDAASGGNLLYHIALAQTRSPLTGDPVSFPASSLSLTIA